MEGGESSTSVPETSLSQLHNNCRTMFTHQQKLAHKEEDDTRSAYNTAVDGVLEALEEQARVERSIKKLSYGQSLRGTISRHSLDSKLAREEERRSTTVRGPPYEWLTPPRPGSTYLEVRQHYREGLQSSPEYHRSNVDTLEGEVDACPAITEAKHREFAQSCRESLAISEAARVAEREVGDTLASVAFARDATLMAMARDEKEERHRAALSLREERMHEIHMKRENLDRERFADEYATRKAAEEAERGGFAQGITLAEQQRLYRDGLREQMEENEISVGVERQRELSMGCALLDFSAAAKMAFDVK